MRSICVRVMLYKCRILISGLMPETYRGVTTSCVQFSLQGKMLIIEGNIAAGKSVLSKRLGDHFNCKIYEECAPKNPNLARFYKDPLKFSLKLQLWLLHERFNMHLDALHHIKDTGQGVIMDRSVYSDLVFANTIYEDGKMSKDGYNHYLKTREKLMHGLIPPAAIIYLDVPPAICSKRIMERGREYEQQISPTYLKKLHNEHQRVFEDISTTHDIPVLTYEWSEFGFDEKFETRHSSIDGTFQYYVSGFKKITKDLSIIDNNSWLPSKRDKLIDFHQSPELIRKEERVNQCDEIKRQISDY